MANKTKVTPGRGLQIREKGVFNFKKLYGEMKGWFDEYKYDFEEKTYSEKDSSKGKEIVIEWRAERAVTDHVKYHIKVSFRFIEITPSSDNFVSGTAKITFLAILETDYMGQWDKNVFSNFLYRMYDKYVIKSFLDGHKAKLSKEVKNLYGVAAQVLDFHR